MEHFEQSKVGIANQVIDSLNKEFSTYFVNGRVTFVDSDLINYGCTRIIPKAPVNMIWDHFENRTINLYDELEEPYTQQLAKLLMDGFNKSEVIRDKNIKITHTHQAKDGLNIHVIRDAREQPEIVETYDAGTKRQIIQHLTVEGVGQFNPSTQKIRWQLKNGRPITQQPEIINLFQNLGIKEDVRHQQLTMVANDLMQITRKYVYYSFKRLSDNLIKVIQGRVSPTGKLTFRTQKVNLDMPNLEDELDLVCLDVWDLNHNRRFESAWDEVECVIQAGNDQLMIKRTTKQLFPKNDELSRRQQRAYAHRRLKKAQAIADLEQLALSKENESVLGNEKQSQADYQLTIRKIIDVIKTIPGTVIRVGDIQRAIKDAGISFRKKAPRDVCWDLENQCGYTFKNSSKQARPYTLFPGFTGIGRTKITETWGTVDYYFVGGNQPLKATITRAIRLRKLVPMTGDDQVIDRMFPDLMELMKVEFVRNGQYTVKPYMLKYLKEYDEFEKLTL
ncbi:hypothetical protein [Lactiplantibacillus carotarum]|uniref:hypothetical protein n=1 Tax=Lactiplantibacillus carotarum TaxID=2993456 RepID=UPI00298EF142|nr:hypothetical protein [Lactiplantibacillus carotarum]